MPNLLGTIMPLFFAGALNVRETLSVFPWKNTRKGNDGLWENPLNFRASRLTIV
jgi:hypothetical protein